MQSRLTYSLLILLSALFAVTSARAHKEIPTNLYPDIELTEEGLFYELWIASFLFPPLDDVTYEDPDIRPTLEERGEAIAKFIDETCPVEIDGIHVKPVFEVLKYNEMQDAYHLSEQMDFVTARIRWSYPIKATPKSIKMRWGIWLTDPPGGWEGLIDPDQNPKELDLLMTVSLPPKRLTENVRFSPEDPEWIWHASVDPTQIIVGELPPLEKPNFSFPIGSAALALGGLLFFAISRKKTSFAIALIAFVGAFFARNAMIIEAPKFWAKSAPPLDTKAATETFIQLQQNIYRAFDYQNESDIYDVLAQSVEGILLDRIYTEISESLILRDQGGGIAKVNKVDVLECNATPLTESGGYEIECHWRVHGIFSHERHTHQRINEYRATFQMLPRLDRWKITDVIVNEKIRVNLTPPASADESESSDTPS
jgi:hypothetical protein